ncbi:MAG: DUF3047 domain-containing protein, partial [Desulfobulbaceae bacterium]|nr:DUF3047 domain-containing protein [Desulfobulbaceae bacterium]
FWKTKALNYVWSAGSMSNKVWPNAFAGKNAMMLSLRSSLDSTKVWYTEKRNVFEDLKKLFGNEFHSIDGVAIMTDTDNSQGKATAYYGDIYFSAQ